MATLFLYVYSTLVMISGRPAQTFESEALLLDFCDVDINKHYRNTLFFKEAAEQLKRIHTAQMLTTIEFDESSD